MPPPTVRIGQVGSQFAVRGWDPRASQPAVRLNDEQYALMTSAVPRVCVDLVIVCGDSMLLGVRASLPVQDWGVPGGKMERGETFDDALQRIASTELNGLQLDFSRLRLIGVSNYIFGEVDRQDVTLHFMYEVTGTEAEGIWLHAGHFTGMKWEVTGIVAAADGGYDPIFAQIARFVIHARGRS